MSTEPIAYTIHAFCARYAVGRSFTYELIKADQLLARKAGRRTLIDAASAAEWYRSTERLNTGAAGRC